MSERPRKTYPLAGRLAIWAVLAQGVVIAVAVAQGDGRLALIAAAALGLTAASAVGSAVAVGGAVFLGAWPVAAIAAVHFVLFGLGKLSMVANAYEMDGVKLGQGVADLAPVLRPVDDAGVVTTLTLMGEARRLRPEWWDSTAPLRKDAPDGVADGPRLSPEPSSGPCTQYAAEAIGFARVVSDRLGIPLDVHLLGATAVFIPNSAAGSRVGETAFTIPLEKLTGAHDLQIVEMLSTFSQKGGAGDLLRRAELVDAGRLPITDLMVTALSQGLFLLRRRLLTGRRPHG